MGQVLVVGGGVAGLSVAIHARLKGHDVTLLEQSEGVGGKAKGIEIEGFRLDPGPSIIILTRIYQELFERAGEKLEEWIQFERLDPFSRVYLEGSSNPIDLPADRQACLKALGDAFPEDREGLHRMMAKLDAAGPSISRTIFKKPIHHWWQLAQPGLVQAATQFDVRKTYRALVDDFFQSDLLRAFFYGFPSYSGQTYHSKAPGALLIPYLMISEGVYAPVGGVAAIPRALQKLAEKIGVVFKTSQKVERVEVRQRKFLAALTQDQTWHKADYVIWAADRLSLAKMMGRPEPKTPSYSYFTMHWGIRREMPDLHYHTLLVPKTWSEGFEELYTERKAPTEPILYINSTPAPEGCTALFAVATVPALEDHIEWEAESQRLNEKIRELLARFGFGFADDEIIFERMQNPRYFLEAHGSWRGSLYGADESERLWQMLPLRCQDEEIGNLYYAGGSVQPGAGLPMVTLSGKFAADLLPG